jgi:hypothetical protein
MAVKLSALRARLPAIAIRKRISGAFFFIPFLSLSNSAILIHVTGLQPHKFIEFKHSLLLMIVL